MIINYTEHIKRWCVDIIKKSPRLKHIDPDKIAYSIGNAREGKSRIRVAAMIGCKPKRGSLADQLGIESQKILTPEGIIAPYMLRVYFLRFYRESIDEKLDTLVHELWHIGEKFDGTLRAEGSHYSDFQDEVNEIICDYIDSEPDMEVVDWFRTRHNVDDFWGWKYQIPKAYNLEKILGEGFIARKEFVKPIFRKITK